MMTHFSDSFLGLLFLIVAVNSLCFFFFVFFLKPPISLRSSCCSSTSSSSVRGRGSVLVLLGARVTTTALVLIAVGPELNDLWVNKDDTQWSHRHQILYVSIHIYNYFCPI